MRSVKFMVVAVLSIVALAACDKEEKASLTLNKTALYFSSWEDSAQIVSYVEQDAEYVAVGSITEGWDATVDPVARRIIVMPVGTTEEGKSNDDLAKEGYMVVNALSRDNLATSCYVYLYICETESLDTEGRANCYVVTKPTTNYTFDVMHRPDGEPLATKSVKLLWQSNNDVVKNVDFVDGRAMFYIESSANDATLLTDTNAVIGACNNAGEVIWSWHLWIVNENPLAEVDTYANGKTFMRKNLGAFINANGSPEEQKILDSYGLYYQWGRKDPFIRPYYYDAAGAESETLYYEKDGYITENFVARTADSGTLDYSIKNPLQYIYNAESSEYKGDSGAGVGDWLVAADNALWSDTDKSLYDPCPYGWRVPTAEDLSVLDLSYAEDNTKLEVARKQFGWHLSDGNNDYFYSACGRRRYTDGKVENINYKDGAYPSQPQPWEGHYWTSTTAADGGAVSLYFDLTTERTKTINKFVKNKSRFRANGMQVRCVKVV